MLSRAIPIHVLQNSLSVLSMMQGGVACIAQLIRDRQCSTEIDLHLQ